MNENLSNSSKNLPAYALRYPTTDGEDFPNQRKIEVKPKRAKFGGLGKDE